MNYSGLPEFSLLPIEIFLQFTLRSTKARGFTKAKVTVHCLEKVTFTDTVPLHGRYHAAEAPLVVTCDSDIAEQSFVTITGVNAKDEATFEGKVSFADMLKNKKLEVNMNHFGKATFPRAPIVMSVYPSRSTPTATLISTKFSCSGLLKMDKMSKSDPVLTLLTSDGAPVLVRPMKPKTLDPEWDFITVPSCCFGDPNNYLSIEVDDYDAVDDFDDIGQVNIRHNELISANALSFTLVHQEGTKKQKQGGVVFVTSTSRPLFNLRHLLQSTHRINLCTAVDMSSGVHPGNLNSKHYEYNNLCAVTQNMMQLNNAVSLTNEMASFHLSTFGAQITDFEQKRVFVSHFHPVETDGPNSMHHAYRKFLESIQPGFPCRVMPTIDAISSQIRSNVFPTEFNIIHIIIDMGFADGEEFNNHLAEMISGLPTVVIVSQLEGTQGLKQTKQVLEVSRKDNPRETLRRIQAFVTQAMTHYITSTS